MKFRSYVFFGLWMVLHACVRDYSIGYHFTGMHLSHLDNSGMSPQGVFKDSLPSKSYGIRLWLDAQMDFQDEAYNAEKSSLINQNPIASILITSSDSFALNLPPGSPLNEYFLYYKGIYGKMDSIPYPKPFFPTNDYIAHNDVNPLPEYADLLLVKTPFKPGIHRFFITLNFEDGSQFIDSLSPIKLY